MESTVKKRTREEVRAAFKEAMRKKKEWIEESNVFLEQIHKKTISTKVGIFYSIHIATRHH